MFVAKKIHIKEGEMKREKNRLLCHKLNITNSIIDEIIPLKIPSVILSIKIQRYRTIYLFKFQYNTLSRKVFYRCLSKGELNTYRKFYFSFLSFISVYESKTTKS
jgi:hypothetical protein